MPQELNASVNLINNKVKFSATAKDHPPVITDYTPPIGDNEGYTSLELFLISLANCSGVAVISLLRKMQKNISGFQVHARGIRKDDHPTCFTNIYLEFVVHSDNTKVEEIERAVNISKEQICPVWAMINDKVEVVAEAIVV